MRVDPLDASTYPRCPCGEEGVYVYRIDPVWDNPRAEGRIGDAGGRGRDRFSRYIVTCDGCYSLAMEADAHLRLVEGIRKRGATHDHDQ